MSSSTARSSQGRSATARSLRAQASMEFMILFILSLIAVTAALVVSVNRSAAVSRAQMDLEAGRVLDTASDRINTVYLEGDGFSMNVTLPERILRSSYTLEILSNEAVMRIKGTTYVRTLLTSEVSGAFAKGTNRISNRDGTILIGEAS